MRIITICAHPDEETLGVGGTLLKHRAAGDELFWIISTQAQQPKWTPEITEKQKTEIESVANAYGMKEYFSLGFPAARLDTVAVDEVILSILEVINKVKPQIVYLVHGGDIHTDHYAVFTAAMSAIKPFRLTKLGIKRVLCFESLSSTEASPYRNYWMFSPNVFNDVTSFLDRKIEIMRLYTDEIHEDPLPRGPEAIRALARFRGATIGVQYAEAFSLLLDVE
jgi:N-acetylglucosamine malate deacetylase 1